MAARVEVAEERNEKRGSDVGKYNKKRIIMKKKGTFERGKT